MNSAMEAKELNTILQIEHQFDLLRNTEGVVDKSITELVDRLNSVCTAPQPTVQENKAGLQEELCPLANAIRTSVNVATEQAARLSYLISRLQV